MKSAHESKLKQLEIDLSEKDSQLNIQSDKLVELNKKLMQKQEVKFTLAKVC